MTALERPSATLLIFAAMIVVSPVCARADTQESKPTIRHHRVAETTNDESAPIDEAETAMQEDDFPAAESLLKKVVDAHADDYRAWFDLGYVYNATNRTPEALEAYRKSVAAKGDVFESNLNLGILLARTGDNAGAAKYLKSATQLKPSAHPEQGLARAWQSLGHVLEGSDPQQAVAAFCEAAKLNPKDADLHISSGVLLEKMNQLEAAAREYATASELDPKSGDALAGLVNVYSKQQKYADAEFFARKLLARNPTNDNARVQLGRILAAEGKNEEATQELQSSTAKAPDDPRAALDLGTLYVKAGKDAEAEQLFRAATAKLPENPEAHFALGSLLMHEKKYPEAQQELLAAVKLKPTLAEAYGNLAVVAAENKNYELAIRALDVRAKLLPEMPATYFLRATSFDNLKAIPQAVENYKRFLAADGGKMPDQEWQARHRLIALDPHNADKYRLKK